MLQGPSINQLIILQSSFLNNSSPTGGAFYLQNPGNIIINSCSFFQNQGISGGAIYYSEDGSKFIKIIFIKFYNKVLYSWWLAILLSLITMLQWEVWFILTQICHSLQMIIISKITQLPMEQFLLHMLSDSRWKSSNSPQKEIKPFIIRFFKTRLSSLCNMNTLGWICKNYYILKLWIIIIKLSTRWTGG